MKLGETFIRRLIVLGLVIALLASMSSLGLETNPSLAGSSLEPEAEWEKTFGGLEKDRATSVQQTSDGGYVLAGYTSSYGAGNNDAWLIKTDSSGTKEWERTFGGSDADYAYSVQQTSDGGYVLAAWTWSYGAGNDDAWLIKTDSSGTKEWERTFGGSDYDDAYSVQQTSDGGYVLAGHTSSHGGGVGDAWLIKTDSSGTKEWERAFGDLDDDFVSSVQQTSDGGYVLAGYTYSYGAGHEDVWLIKTDSSGNKQWERIFGGSEEDRAWCVQQTSDGGYILAGATSSYGAGNNDVWLIKTDSSGTKEWDSTFGGSDTDHAYSVQQTSDGGYVLAGYTYSYGAGVGDAWLIKIAGETRSPNQPTNVSPADGATAISLSPTLQSSPFCDPDVGDTHAASQWQIATTQGDYSNPVFDSGTDNTDLTSITMPEGKLSYSTTHYWHVKYQDNHGAWSAWSEETSFTTHAEGTAPASPDEGKGGLPFWIWIAVAVAGVLVVGVGAYMLGKKQPAKPQQ